MPVLFGLGTFLIGFGAGLFGHGTLTSTMNLAPKDQAGMALGTWGAVQATAAGLAMAFGGVLRDSVASWSDSATGYHTVYGLELVLLCLTIVAMLPLIRSKSNAIKPII
jgi:BCD family chlorophyll transporter-like MFS transporter